MKANGAMQCDSFGVTVHRGRGVFAAVLGFGLLCTEPALGGKLQDARDTTSYSSSDDDDDDDDDDCGWLQLLLFGCPSQTEQPSVAGPAAVVAQRAHRRELLSRLESSKFFPAYPYADGRPGNLLRLHLPHSQLEPEGCSWDLGSCDPYARVVACIDAECYQERQGAHVDLPEEAMHLRASRGQLFADLGQDGDGLTRVTLGGVIMTNDLFGLDSRWTYWSETLDDGSMDGLWMGDVNVHLQLLTLPAFQWSVGAGPRALTDGDGGSAGINLTSRVELYPVAPLVLRAEGDVGTLGTALAWESRNSVGLLWQHVEFCGGYDFLRVGELNFDSWFGGVRAHF